jgi:glutamine amidotransferase-like uncharacterized protein
MSRIIFILLLFVEFCWGTTNKRIAIYQHDPLFDADCAQAIKCVLQQDYKTVIVVTQKTCNKDLLKNIDCIVFPGGMGDVDNFDVLMKSKKRLIRNYVSQGGKYLGICMGAYVASKLYFNILGETTAEQYIKHAGAEVHTKRDTISKFTFQNNTYMTYFYDGPVFEDDLELHQILATYHDGSAAAIMKPYGAGRALCVGPHLESQQDWYDTPELRPHWHGGRHHALLLKMVKKLLE